MFLSAEGWNTEVKRIPKAQEVETELPTAHNPGEDRVSDPLALLQNDAVPVVEVLEICTVDGHGRAG